MLYIKPFDSKNTFFNKGRIDLEKISHYQDQLLIIECSSEHCGDQDWLLQLHEKLSTAHPDFYILSHHPGDHLLLPQLLHFPFWYLHSCKKFKRVDTNGTRSRLIGCLQANVRPHRIAHFYALKKRFREQEMHVSMFQQDHISMEHAVELHEQEQQFYQSAKNLLPDIREREDHLSITLPALTDSYLHIISETTVRDRIFLSEKTWKPIAAGQLFLMFGNPGSIAHLRSLGVDTFDDIIDHDRYDHIIDWRGRMDAMHDIIDERRHENWQQIYHSTRPRRLNNQARFFSGDFQHIYRHERIDTLLEPYVSRG